MSHKHNHQGRLCLWIILIVMLLPSRAGAADFTIESFRELPNDVTAFISPVLDLNGERCALLKIEAPEEFEFATPLGIVSRVNMTGEIWLYLPGGSKMITVKHPSLGIIRDYLFPDKLVGQHSYEMRLKLPEAPPATIVHHTVHDTLTILRTDTLVMHAPKKKIPFTSSILLTASMGSGSAGVLGGIMATAMKRVGGFIHFITGFGHTGPTAGTCEADGTMNGHMPYYSGKIRRSMYMLNAGAIVRITGGIAAFAGAGYGDRATAWELSPAEGGGYVRNTGYCRRGVAYEAGALMSFGRVSVMASISTIRCRDWYGSIGVGIRIGKKNQPQPEPSGL